MANIAKTLKKTVFFVFAISARWVDCSVGLIVYVNSLMIFHWFWESKSIKNLPKIDLRRVLEASWGVLGRPGGVLGACWARLGASWKRLGSQNHPQHKPDLTWNGKRRSFFWSPPARFAFLNKSLGTFWIAKPASSSWTLRSLRSPHRGEFSFNFHCLFELLWSSRLSA